MATARPKLVYSTTIMASFARRDAALLAERYQVVSFVFSPRSKLLTPWVMIRQLLFLLRHMPGASVSVTQFGGFHSFFPVLLGRWMGVPAVVVLGGFDCASFPSFRYGAHHRFPMGAITRWSLRRASLLVPCSANLVRSEQSYSAGLRDPRAQGYKAFDPTNEAPLAIIPYGYDSERFKPAGARDPRSFLTVAQMNPSNFTRKGIDLVFALAERLPDCRFTVVGNTPAMRYARVPPNVQLIGFVPYEDLPGVYARHAYYLQLSIWEGFPSAPCEAMLCGCVPIASAVAALPEIVGDAGYLVPVREIDPLERIVRLALTEGTERLSVRARARIQERYPVETRRAFLHAVERVARGLAKG
jgi:glycosyltransferase involved in cell wall biosynthesis